MGRMEAVVTRVVMSLTTFLQTMGDERNNTVNLSN